MTSVCERVLVVDDQKGVRQLLREALRIVDVTAELASDGQQALDRLSQESFGLVLLDMKMPGMSGLEVLTEMRKRGDPTPVWMMTAYEEVKLYEEAQRLGAEQYVIKPFDVMDLAQKINMWLRSPV
ncbi:response regulator [Heliobacillus mobilis]|uniref:Stage 0 sporulation protein A homolog n=1 Tax=Heliobacterium mobile TaxID=28064 RepID=Q0PIJ8_HELMO|nr:response regulator [Heliobacterium mobile]ABH04819.1 Spo0F [Heliobacterium mobile]MTV49553.1 response regulator [Heliobacterium mobile]